MRARARARHARPASAGSCCHSPCLHSLTPLACRCRPCCVAANTRHASAPRCQGVVCRLLPRVCADRQGPAHAAHGAPGRPAAQHDRQHPAAVTPYPGACRCDGVRVELLRGVVLWAGTMRGAAACARRVVAQQLRQHCKGDVWLASVACVLCILLFPYAAFSVPAGVWAQQLGLACSCMRVPLCICCCCCCKPSCHLWMLACLRARAQRAERTCVQHCVSSPRVYHITQPPSVPQTRLHRGTHVHAPAKVAAASSSTVGPSS